MSIKQLIVFGGYGEIKFNEKIEMEISTIKKKVSFHSINGTVACLSIGWHETFIRNKNILLGFITATKVCRFAAIYSNEKLLVDEFNYLQSKTEIRVGENEATKLFKKNFLMPLIESMIDEPSKFGSTFKELVSNFLGFNNIYHPCFCCSNVAATQTQDSRKISVDIIENIVPTMPTIPENGVSRNLNSSSKVESTEDLEVLEVSSSFPTNDDSLEIQENFQETKDRVFFFEYEDEPTNHEASPKLNDPQSQQESSRSSSTSRNGRKRKPDDNQNSGSNTAKKLLRRKNSDIEKNIAKAFELYAEYATNRMNKKLIVCEPNEINFEQYCNTTADGNPFKFHDLLFNKCSPIFIPYYESIYKEWKKQNQNLYQKILEHNSNL